MSPIEAGKPTAATLARSTAHRTPATDGVTTQLQKGDGTVHGPATNRTQPRPVRAPRLGRSRGADLPQFDDPCNYLG
jgi:hypothetical protein